MKKVSIIGIGRVGLSLALAFADRGCKVIGVDIDEEKNKVLNSGKVPFIEEGAEQLLKKHINKNFKIETPNKSDLSDCNFLILSPGTPIDEHMNPIFSQIEAAIQSIIPNLTENQTIILRSTVSPGTTEYLRRYLEKNTKFKIGQNLFLAYCPERVAEGKSIEELSELPQIIGSLDDVSAQKCEELFKLLIDKIMKTDARSAEIAKLYCNMYRYIDFAIANEFMMIAEQYDCDIYEILNIVNKDYKRGGLKQPGLTAGPCLYKDGFFLINKTPYTELISTSWKINETVPAYLIERIKKRKKIEGSRVALLGLSYKREIDDTRNSLSFKVKKILLSEGAEVVMHDPFITKNKIKEVLKDADIAFFAMNHNFYKNYALENLKKYVKKGCIVCDVWNLFGTGKTIFEI